MKLIISFLALGLSLSALAQNETDVAAAEIEAAKKTAAEKQDKGWQVGLKLGATGALLDNRSFVGQPDGTTFQFGMVLGGNADLVAGSSDWRNSLTLNLATLKTPAIDSFIKSSDALEFKSLYLYHIPGLEWVGPYARGRAFTQMFPGAIINADTTKVIRTNNDGAAVTETVPGQTAIELTNFFEPLVLEESVGAFMEPIKSDTLTLTLNTGLAAQELFTQGGYAVSDNADTPELEVSQLANVLSAGAEAGAEAKGVVIKDMLNWFASAGVYYPVIINDTRGLEGLDLLHTTLGGGISLKLAKWVSVDYGIKVLRQPFIIEDWQIQNNILISTGFDLL